MSFSQKVARWAYNAGQEIEALQKAIILELFTSVILDSPVLEGRLRGNWLITSGTPGEGVVDVLDPTGNITTRKISNFVRSIDAAENYSVYLTNNLPYAYRIEYDGWSHTKAPEGMVRKNFIRISQNLKTGARA